MTVMEGKGKQRRKDLWSSGSGGPVKFGPGELNHSFDRGLSTPGSQDLAI